MRAVPISFTPVNSTGEHPQTGGGRFVNAIGEQLEDQRVLIKRAPGLKTFVTSPNSHCRGMILANQNVALVVFDDVVETLVGNTRTVGGEIPSTDRVSLARNNAVTPDVVCVSSAGVYTITAAGVVAPYPDANIGSPIDVCFTGGYFFFVYGDGTCQASGLNSTSINTLDRIKAESRSRGLLRGVPHHGQLFLCGPASIEVWSGDQPNAEQFPFNRLTVIEAGLFAKHAIAGYEDQFMSSLLWAAPTCHIYMLEGYSPRKISTPTIERALQDLQSAGLQTTLRAFVAVHQGHPVAYFKCATWTWAYDLATSTWQERKSHGLERWRAEQSLFVNGEWLLGDDTNGNIYTLDAETSVEGTTPVVFDVESQVSEAFPLRKGVKRADFNFAAGTGEAGSGDTPATEPRCLVYWSDDGGRNWSRPLERKIGRLGEYEKVVTVKRCGHMGSHGRKWRLVVSDPGFVGLFGGVMWIED